MVLAHVAETARRGVRLVEIGEKQLATTSGRVGAIGEHAVDAVLVLFQTLFVDFGRECQFLSIHPRREIGHRSHILARDVVNDALSIECFECMIDLMLGEIALFGKGGFFDKDVVGENTRVLAQKCGEHLVATACTEVNAVEFIALHNHHDARFGVVFVGVGQIAGALQDGEGIDHGEGEMLELGAEFF